MGVARKPERRVRRTSRACTNCQRRKVKCNGGQPCLSCIGSQSKCKYSNQTQQNSLFTSIGVVDGVNRSHLITGMGSNVPSNFQKFFAEAASFLDALNPRFCLTLDTKEISAYSGSDSIETEIVGKQSQFLNRFSNILPVKAKQALTMYFGLYSSLLYFTPMGISWLVQKLIYYSDERSSRETIYLVLKFLDTSTSNYQSNQRLRLCYPLKYYAHSYSLLYDEQNIIGHILNRVRRCYEEEILPSGHFTELQDPTEAFSFSVSILKQHQVIFNTTKLSQTGLKEYLEEGDSILCLCTEFFERCTFSQMHDTSLLKSLLSLTEHTYWREDKSYLGRLINIMSRRGLDLGLNRWEYYIMKEESAADEERRLWWDIYWWDKWYASITGKPPTISDEINLCLFSRGVMQMGVDDSMDCLSLIQMVQLDSSDPDSCVRFCRILMAKIINRVFSVVLYDRKFTDYRLFTMAATQSLTGIVKQVKAETDTIFDIFMAFQSKIGLFLRSNFEKTGFFETYIQSGFVAVTSFQSMESLLLRVQNLSNIEQKVDLSDSLTQCETRISKYSTEILLSTMKASDKFQVIKGAWAVFTTLINYTACLVKNPGDSSLYRLSLICGVVSRYTESVSCTDEGSSSWTRLMQGTRFSLILTRICCQAIISTQKVSIEDLKMELLNYGPSCAEIFESALDINCLWYESLLCNKHQSVFSEAILRNIDRNVNDFTQSKEAGLKTDSETSGGNESRPKAAEKISKGIDMQSLETFLNSDATLDFITTFWNDAQPSIFDFVSQQSDLHD